MRRSSRVREEKAKRRRQLGLERLERREVPATIDFGMAIGLGSSGRYSDIRANAVVDDAAGNIIVTGSFAVSAGFNPSAPSNLTNASGARDLFVARFTPAGALSWLRTFPGQVSTSNGITTSSTAQGSAVAVDGSGNLFVSGTFSGTVDFDPGAGVTTLASPGRSDAFILKLDASGNFLWVRAMTEAASDVANAYAVAADGSGGVYVAGAFQESLTVGTTTLVAGGLSDAFVARLNSTGQFQWAVASRGSGSSNSEIHGLAVDASGQLVAAGLFAGTVDFDPGPNVTSITANGSTDASLWKLSPTGQLVWARGIGGSDYDAATGVAVDASGNAYVTGTFSTSANFGTAANPDVLQTTGSSEIFLARYGVDGSKVWAKRMAGSAGSASQARGIAVSGSGRIHIAGTFQGTVDFDPGPNVAALTGQGYSDAFVAGYAADGSLVYDLRAGKTGSTLPMGVAVDASGFASIVGSYVGPITFGSITVPAVGSTSIFVARVTSGSVTPPAPAAPVLQASSDTGRSATDRITATRSPQFDVVASAAANTIRLLRGGVVVATRVGSGAVADPGPVADGTYIYTAVEVNIEGIAGGSSLSTSVTIDGTAPAAPATPGLLAADDTGVLGDGLTAIRTPRITGTAAEANGTVSWLKVDGSVLTTTTASASGTYTLTAPSALVPGTYAVRVRVTDAAGNVGAVSSTFALIIRAVAGDFDGDGKTDPAVFRPSNGTFYVARSAVGDTYSQSWGVGTDVPVAADYDGDGKTDIAVFRPSNGTFYILGSSRGGFSQAWGTSGDVPVPADYDGDGKADIAVFRPSNGTFYVLRSSDGGGYSQGWGGNGDTPVPADYDGDGKADFAVYRPSNGTFYVLGTSRGGYSQGWGGNGDIPVPADYDGDGKADFAVYRPSNGTYYVLRSGNGAGFSVAWGVGSDVPVPGDYDGDGVVDFVVHRTSSNSFLIRRSTTLATTTVALGVSGDRAVLGRFAT